MNDINKTFPVDLNHPSNSPCKCLRVQSTASHQGKQQCQATIHSNITPCWWWLGVCGDCTRKKVKACVVNICVTLYTHAMSQLFSRTHLRSWTRSWEQTKYPQSLWNRVNGPSWAQRQARSCVQGGPVPYKTLHPHPNYHFSASEAAFMFLRIECR